MYVYIYRTIIVMENCCTSLFLSPRLLRYHLGNSNLALLEAIRLRCLSKDLITIDPQFGEILCHLPFSFIVLAMRILLSSPILAGFVSRFVNGLTKHCKIIYSCSFYSTNVQFKQPTNSH